MRVRPMDRIHVLWRSAAGVVDRKPVSVDAGRFLPQAAPRTWPSLRMSGYQPRRPTLYRAWNIALVVPLLLLCLPLICGIVTLLTVAQGPRNVFYRGARMGKDQRIFMILKFKTLRDDASEVTRDRVLPDGAALETRFGRFLRDTRLDELPQLFNVLAGSMNMLGPRPVRPCIAELCRDRVRQYDSRFLVKPGLIGYTQALMPHGTDKAIRARVNAILCRRPVRLRHEILFVALTAYSVLRWTASLLWRAALCRLCPRPADWAPDERPCKGEVLFEGPDHVAGPGACRLVALGGTSLRLESDRPLPLRQETYGVRLRPSRRGKSARCTARLVLQQDGKCRHPGCDQPVYHYAMRYSAETPLNRYLIDRYLLGKVVVG